MTVLLFRMRYSTSLRIMLLKMYVTWKVSFVSLMANAVINNKEIDLPLTKRVVSQAVRLEKKKLSVQMIQEIVCNYFNLDQAVIQTRSRKREIVQARQITMYLAKKYTDCSFPILGRL